MPKKNKSKKNNTEYDIEEEIIIGYNTKKQKDNPSKSKNKKKTIKNPKVSKKSKKKKKKKGKLKKILKILLKLLILIAIAIALILFLFVSPVFNIKEIVVIGAYEKSESAYIATSGIEIGENIFEIDTNTAISEIVKDPYVESIYINRKYPSTVEIQVEERKISYIAEQNGKYYSIDKNGYILENSLSPIDFPEIKGYTTNLESKENGDRIEETDFSRFNDLIKIIDAVQNNNIDAKLKSINISNNNNYILEFASENKNVMLGDAKDLSVKMAWINLFIQEKKNESGTIHLDGEKEVYFSPNS